MLQAFKHGYKLMHFMSNVHYDCACVCSVVVFWVFFYIIRFVLFRAIKHFNMAKGYRNKIIISINFQVQPFFAS